jgi:tripartite-type tricarboxylate transporter receptor subunit TctC
MQRLCSTFAIALAAFALATGVALAQSYPSKPIRVIVPFVAGGAVDALARMIGQKVSEQLGQPVVIENRPGAGGNVAADAVAKSPADGYTILQNTNGQAISPAIYRTLPFDVVRDFIPVTQLVASQLVLAASPKHERLTSVKELIAQAKAKPGSLNYGMTGVGNPLHLTMEMLKTAAGVDIQAVPYKGDAAIFPALITGEIHVAIVPMATSLGHVRGGTVRALAIGGSKRSPALPDVPTVAEAALPGFESTSWQGWFVPAGTPPDVVAAIQRAAAKALTAPDVLERLRTGGNEAVGSSSEEFATRFRADLAKFAKIVKEAHIPQQD